MLSDQEREALAKEKDTETKESRRLLHDRFTDSVKESIVQTLRKGGSIVEIINELPVVEDSPNDFGLDLRFIDLSHYDLHGVNLREVNFTGAFLTRTNFQRANLKKSRFAYTNLHYINLKDANLQEAQLWHAEMKGSILENANLWETDLSRAKLQGANLKDAQMQGAKFRGANLSGANLINANMRNAQFTGADLSNSNISGAKVYGVDFRTAAKLNGIIRDNLIFSVDGITPGVEPPNFFVIYGTQETVPRVFLSYAWSDKESVLAVDQWLRDKGARVIIDDRNFNAGKYIRDQIIYWIQQAGVVVLFYSNAEKKRPYPELERHIAEELERSDDVRIIYFCLDKTKLPLHEKPRLAIQAWRMSFIEACEELWRAIIQTIKPEKRIDLDKYIKKSPWEKNGRELFKRVVKTRN
jgi:hypothetical protein